jgi:hypothetical protein
VFDCVLFDLKLRIKIVIMFNWETENNIDWSVLENLVEFDIQQNMALSQTSQSSQQTELLSVLDLGFDPSQLMNDVLHSDNEIAVRNDLDLPVDGVANTCGDDVNDSAYDTYSDMGLDATIPSDMPISSPDVAQPSVYDISEWDELGGTVLHLPEFKVNTDMTSLCNSSRTPLLDHQYDLPLSVPSYAYSDIDEDDTSEFNVTSTSTSLVCSSSSGRPLGRSRAVENGGIFSDDYLYNTDTKTFNEQLRIHRVSSARAKELKHRRRTLKNRSYAQQCRSKRISRQSELDVENARLRQLVRNLQCQLLEKSSELEQKVVQLNALKMRVAKK